MSLPLDGRDFSLPSFAAPPLDPTIVEVALGSTDNLRPGLEQITLAHRDGRTETLALHNYDRLYEIEGLYELVVQAKLQCTTPDMVAAALATHLLDNGRRTEDVSVLDLGAGNGVSGVALSRRGLRTQVGIDIDAAKQASQRDYPGLFAEFLNEIPGGRDLQRLINRHQLTTLVSSGALGGNHVPIEDFERLWSYFPHGSLLCVTIPNVEVDPNDEFGSLLRDPDRTDVHVLESFPYRHRLRMSAPAAQDWDGNRPEHDPADDRSFIDRTRAGLDDHDWYRFQLVIAQKN